MFHRDDVTDTGYVVEWAVKVVYEAFFYNDADSCWMHNYSL